MSSAGPMQTVNELAEAINKGDLERAIARYEPDGMLVVQPGTVARGGEELRSALQGFIATRPTLVSHAQSVLEYGDLALYTGRWDLRGTGPDGKEVAFGGVSSDVLRRQKDGRWLIAIDNPWGAQILPPA